VWVAVLALAVVLPGVGVGREGAAVGSRPDAASALKVDWRGDASGEVAEVQDRAAGVQGQDRRTVVAEEAGIGRADRVVAALRELVRVRRVRLTARATHLLVGLYGATLGFGLLRIVRAWVAARGLVRRSRETSLAEWVPELWQRYGGRVLPELRESAEVTSPVVVGAWASVLLLPEGMGRYTQEEVRAVLCHELAHVARRDYLANLACQVAGVPLAWHPVVYAVQQQIRRTREMVCDRMAAREMESELVYARCLLRLARDMFGAERVVAEPGVGLFTSNVLEERVMRLIGEQEMRLRTKVVRVAWAAVGMVSALTVAATVHVTPTWAATEQAAAPALLAESAGASVAMAPQVAAVAAPEATVAQASAPAAAPAPAQNSAPPAAPVPAPRPAPAAQPARPAPAHVHSREKGDGMSADGGPGPLTPEEQQRFEARMADVQREVEAATAKLNSPEFQRQMEEMNRKVGEATAKMDSPEFRRQMAEIDRKVAEATAKVNSPEFHQQIDEAARSAANEAARVDNAEFRRSMEKMQREVAEATAEVNSPEFQKRIQEQVRQAQQRMEEACRRMREAHPETPGGVK
jgi:beta-lactamase regulating signal transducer with metallopeptidase domain